MTTLSDEEVLAAWGDTPDAVADGLRRFSETTQALSSDRPRLIDAHPQEWVALFDSVEVTGQTLESVIAQLDERGIPRSETIVRYINVCPKTLIL